jgi:hypothetical protein
MILHRSFSGNVTSSEATVFTLIGPNTLGASVALENKDSLNYVSYRFQGATINTDSSYADLVNGSGNVGVSGILAPGDQVLVTLANTNAYTRMLASSSGGARVEMGITQFSPNASTNFTSGQL